MSDTLATEPQQQSRGVSRAIWAFFFQLSIIGVYIILGANIVQVSTRMGYVIVAANCLAAGLAWMYALPRSTVPSFVKLIIAIDFALMTVTIMQATGFA